MFETTAPSDADTIYDPAEIARRRTKDLRRKHPRRDTNDAYESALTEACLHSGLTKRQGRLFMSYFVEALADRLLRGRMVRIPRLALMAVVPIACDRKFRVAFCADPALRLRVHQEMYEPCRDRVAAFYAACRSLVCAVPSYVRRGSTFSGLMAQDRRRAERESDAELTLEDFERAEGF